MYRHSQSGFEAKIYMYKYFTESILVKKCNNS